MPKHQMTLSEFRQQLTNYPTNFLLCKDKRHKWDEIQNLERQPDGWVTRVDQCSRCKTKRTDFFALGRDRLIKRYSNYAYPNGFAFHGLPDAEKLSEIIRFEAFKRSNNDNYHEEDPDDV